MKTLKGTKTAENLMKSFAGESQARERYTFYASAAKKEGYVQMSNIFMETALQEEQHAKRFMKFLIEELNGQEIEITAGYPVGLSKNTIENLKFAAAGEHEEHTDLYPVFAVVAREEGFETIAKAFEEISKVEERHEIRFRALLANIENDIVFKKEKIVLWKCLNCGYIYEGKEAPMACPACLHPQGYFELFLPNY
ncbi:rubrerythrin [uncultured Clostridium sp.]|jgi:rubrerythrin|uniref:rubrerythrin n=1 Tax=uncultured Clostridium sp. TaxID=59620 RepID=UPI002625797B|nr:rubrerythrin family protein [uncultured Clostridium sp.]